MSQTGEQSGSSDKPQEFEGRLAQDKDWREIVAWVGDLPPMPQVASRAIAMVENPDTSAQELCDLLATDTALAARVLKIANSAMFSRQREITTLTQAVMVMGFKVLKGIIVAATLRQLNQSFGKMEKLIWENSMCTAMCATLIGKKLRKPYVEEIFLLGLLHSLGQIVLLAQPETSKDYKLVLEKIEKESLDYQQAEQNVFGFAHPLIGALVAKKWNFSADTCQVILHYRDPLEGTQAETPLDEKTYIVQVADLIAHKAKIGSPEGYPEPDQSLTDAIQYIGFTRDPGEVLEELLEETVAQFESEGSIYG